MDLSFIQTLEPEGRIVIAVILALFVIGVVLLIAVTARYGSLAQDLNRENGSPRSSFALSLRDEFVGAYRRFGKETNTPAIINHVITTKLSRLLFFERFMNNAVALFVTLGLFGTFLGLALSVGSLTELLGSGSSTEWLNVLDNVGSGLFSALSGMGVAFYTSLVGVACSIFFTLLRAIFNPQAKRQALETTAEIWLDHTVSALLSDESPADDTSRLITLKKELRMHAAAVTKALSQTTEQMQSVFTEAVEGLNASIEYSKEPVRMFNKTVSTFNDNVRDFSSINYDLRGSIERMDIAVRDLSDALRRVERGMKPDERRGGSER